MEKNIEWTGCNRSGPKRHKVRVRFCGTSFGNIFSHELIDIEFDRYNAVFHMVTAADGASAFYTLENNQARTETPEQAVDLDRRTQKCWLGHPHM